MAHGELRTEKNCLNCNAQVNGRFCSVCGQQNVEPKETFWQLISHFVYDLFHYDGKVLSTVKKLIFKPGLLTHEYVRGRRASYLHPIRLYIFISAVFFIIFISFIVGNKININENPNQFTAQQNDAINKTVDRLKDSLAKTHDPEKKAELQKSINVLQKVPGYFTSDSTTFYTEDAEKDSHKIDSSSRRDNLVIGDLPGTTDEYYQQQAKLPPDKKDNWLERTVSVKVIQLSEKYKNDKKGFINNFTEHFLHSLPTMMFVSLPVVALIFQLLYIRRRKQFTYVQHGVFSVHIYTTVYIFILVIYVLDLLKDFSHWNLFGYISVITSIGVFYYIYRAMRNFYEQGRWKTVLKFLILLILYYLILLILMCLFLLTSLIQV